MTIGKVEKEKKKVNRKEMQEAKMSKHRKRKDTRENKTVKEREIVVKRTK